ncbi:hypothetical protein HGRIS_011289 [Hohenbuehelia grisea]|uniref:SGNH hydrolase-type esterase domain-containing protein n=1 Tax=Hohenbuehelia grisea TaxID=104357 RepID=A0ABR3JUN8_9AGAR
MPQLTEASNLPPAPFNAQTVVFKDSTIRQTLKLTLGTSRLRIRISNAFGTTPLSITAASIALPVNNSAGVNAIQPNTAKTITFSGQPSFTLPNAALAISDPIDFPGANAGAIVAVTLYLAQGQQGQDVTSHPGSRTTSWFTFGNQVTAATLTGSALASAAHWYFLSAVEAWTDTDTSSLVLIGDSITDGRGSTTDQNDRWSDALFKRLQTLQSPLNKIAVSNQAAGGNRILLDGLGPSTLARIERDVLSHPNVGYAVIFSGVNDIGVAAASTAAQTQIFNDLIAAYSQIISRIHASGIPVIGATITPFSAPNSTIQPYSDAGGIREATRQKVNNWIKNTGGFDAVADFDAAVKDPASPTRLSPLYNSGDFLHLNPAGYAKLADAFPVNSLVSLQGGVSGFK